jgi:hypothetical protein
LGAQGRGSTWNLEHPGINLSIYQSVNHGSTALVELGRFFRFVIYRVIQEELPLLMELTSEDILSKKCHINMGPIHNIYIVTFLIGNALQ